MSLTGASPPGPSGEAALAALPIVERLRQTAASETEDIARGRPVHYEAYSLARTRACSSSTACFPRLAGRPRRPLARGARRSHAKLEANRRALGVQLKACAAVSEIIARAIQDGQSDGTYTALAWRGAEE